MFGLSFGELLVICVVALLVLGPEGLPTLARTVGKALRQFRSATGDLRQAMESEFYRMDDPPKVTPRPRPEGAVSRVEPAAGALPTGDDVRAVSVDPPAAAPVDVPASPIDVPSGAVSTPPTGGRA